MSSTPETLPDWIVVRLDDDLNCWPDEASEEVFPGALSRGVLDPRQLSHLVQALEEYLPHGYRKELFASAFQTYVIQSELSDGRLRLARADEDVFDADTQLFAIPIVDEEEGTGAYYDFLDDISTARVRFLNATHHYVRNCTELDMDEELENIDRDRYFAADSIHVFDEINEILEWKPAE
jgi:hypothetical protein